MPGEQFLLLQMHEMLNYLNQSGVTTMLILGQHGLVGDMRSDIDLSYLSDTILLFRFFEAESAGPHCPLGRQEPNEFPRTLHTRIYTWPRWPRSRRGIARFRRRAIGPPSYKGDTALLPSATKG